MDGCGNCGPEDGTIVINYLQQGGGSQQVLSGSFSGATPSTWYDENWSNAQSGEHQVIITFNNCPNPLSQQINLT